MLREMRLDSQPRDVVLLDSVLNAKFALHLIKVTNGTVQAKRISHPGKEEERWLLTLDSQ